VKLKILALLIMLSLNAGAVTLIYEDTTHLNKILCCNALPGGNTTCYILRDLNYIGPSGRSDIGDMGITDAYFTFNNVTMVNVTVCYDIGNTYNVNVGNWAFMNLNTMGIVGFIAVFIIIIIYIVLKKSSNRFKK